MNLTFQSVLDFGFDETLEILNRGYSDYMVPIHLDSAGFHRMIRVDGIDVSLSQVVIKTGKGVGASLIARRGWSSRLAGMAIIPEARGAGVGGLVMEELIRCAQERGDHRMELEVILGNDPATHLFRKVGFQKIRKLVSFKSKELSGEPSNLEMIDIREVSRIVAAFALPKLPWQLSSQSLAQLTPPNLAFHLDSAWAVISSPQGEQINLSSLVVNPDYRHRGRASRLLRALFAKYPKKIWYIPAIYPEEVSATFVSVGFQQQILSQYQMELDL
jgi:ribosomal protein S18 acetylase RimI-like enzyme